MKEWLKAIIILPFNVLVTIPCLILYFTKFEYNIPSIFQIVLGLFMLALGIWLAVWTMFLFYKIGKGTPAPWAAPKHLVVQGPYKYVRNPMISGVLFILTAEVLILNSFALFCWAISFFFINCVYFKLFEEKQLEKTFGQSYLEYKKKVPMWIPKWK